MNLRTYIEQCVRLERQMRNIKQALPLCKKHLETRGDSVQYYKEMRNI